MKSPSSVFQGKSLSLVCTYRVQVFPSASQGSLGTTACVPDQPFPSTSCCLFINHYCNYNILSIERSCCLHRSHLGPKGHNWASSHPRFQLRRGSSSCGSGQEDKSTLKYRTEQYSIPVDFQSRRLMSWNRAACVLSIKISVIFS